MEKIKIVGILQNAWSTYWWQHDHWPRHHWLEALKRSRTGQRLKLLEDERLDIWYDETTPKVADNPRTILPADLDYMTSFIREQNPDVIVTFGKPACEAMKKLVIRFQGIPMCFLPHPTYRFADNNVFLEAKKYLLERHTGYRQYKVLKDRSVIVIDQKHF